MSKDEMVVMSQGSVVAIIATSAVYGGFVFEFVSRLMFQPPVPLSYWLGLSAATVVLSVTTRLIDRRSDRLMGKR
jgi:hypothetical protein